MTAHSLMASTDPGDVTGRMEANAVRSAYSFDRVLVGFDASPDAAEALRLAAAICGSGELVVLCVIARVLHLDSGGDGGNGAALLAAAELILSELDTCARPADRVRARVQVVSSAGDSPGNVVTSYAEQHGFDLLVLGRHGAGGRRRSMLGRVAERAARACPVPVLLTSAPGRDEHERALRGKASSGHYLPQARAGW